MPRGILMLGPWDGLSLKEGRIDRDGHHSSRDIEKAKVCTFLHKKREMKNSV